MNCYSLKSHFCSVLLSLFLGISCFAQTTITADIDYPSSSGLFAEGSYKIFSSTTKSITDLNKVVILVSDYDPEARFNEDYYANLFQIARRGYLGTQLVYSGYDIVVLEFNNSGDFIQKNAFLLVKLLEEVNANKQGNTPVVTVGLGLGCLISRYALCYMESANYNGTHGCSKFVSIDGYNQGANIPLSAQFWVQGWQALASLNPLTDSTHLYYNSIAAKQFLYCHYDSSRKVDPVVPAPSVLKDLFFNELRGLNNKNGYPDLTLNIGFSSGSRYGKLQHVWVDSSGVLVKRPILPSMMLAEHEAYANGTVPLGTEHLYATIGSQTNTQTDELLYHSNLIQVPVPNSQIYMKKQLSTPEYETIPGSTFDWIDFFSNSITYFYNTNMEYAGNDLNTCFVPTISALDLNTTNHYWSIEYDIDIICNSNFDVVYAPARNLEYLQVGVTGANWLFNQIVNDEITLTNETFNMGRDVMNVVYKDIIVGDNAVLSINDGGKTDFTAKNQNLSISYLIAPTIPNSNFKAETSECHPSTLTVESGGVFKLGDGINRTAEFHMKDDSRLVLNKNSNLVVNEGCSLRIYPNAEMNIEDSVTQVSHLFIMYVFQPKMERLH
jgi:hypothetical protein